MDLLLDEDLFPKEPDLPPDLGFPEGLPEAVWLLLEPDLLPDFERSPELPKFLDLLSFILTSLKCNECRGLRLTRLLYL